MATVFFIQILPKNDLGNLSSKPGWKGIVVSNSRFNSLATAMNSSRPQASTYLDFIQSRQGRRANQDVAKTLFSTADEKMMRIQDIIWQIADTQVPVLITGESGVGKEVVARAVHNAANQGDRPFIAVNCAALPPTLLESELFGFEKGAFTGAHQRHLGRFEQAKGGTLLLDEITEIEIGLQAKLLRAIQEKEIQRIGGSDPIAVDTRIIATTNRDILEAIKKGQFRQDLYYRLYVFHIEIPPLRERPKDILHLGELFLQEGAKNFDKPNLTFSDEAKARLEAHHWPGNVRELHNVVQRAAIVANGQVIQCEHLPLENQGGSLASDWISALPIGTPLKIVETHFILETLKNHRGNRTHAAKTLGISLRTLRNKINEYTAAGFDVTPPMNWSQGHDARDL
ncbi:MAG: sigma-54 interaction domain-containing protein [Oligoflexales bacterium]